MSQTNLVTSITKTGTYPTATILSAGNNCGMLKLILGSTWSEQMIHELPTVNVTVYSTDDTKLTSFDIDMRTVNEENVKLEATEPYAIPIYNLPSAFIMSVTPLFDNYALTSHNDMIESGNIDLFNTTSNGIVDSNSNNYSNKLWTIPTSTFDITVSFDDTNVSSQGGNGGGGSGPSITIDSQVLQGSTNPVQNGAIYDFVNSSVSTNTSYFIGTFNSLSDLESYSGTITNNDYAFVISTDSSGNTVYNRYKYNGETDTWNFEYALNNSSFTAAQWATITSGFTEEDRIRLQDVEAGANKTVVDSALSTISTNPVQNTIITQKFNNLFNGSDYAISDGGTVSVNQRSTIEAHQPVTFNSKLYYYSAQDENSSGNYYYTNIAKDSNNHDVVSIAAINKSTWVTNFIDNVAGSVLSVGITAGDGLTVTGSPITSSGTITVSMSDITNLPDGTTQDLYVISYNTKGQITNSSPITSITLNCVPDETTYISQMRTYFGNNDADNLTPAQLTDLCNRWYANTRDSWNGYTTFTTTGVSTGTKGGDNTGLVCVPSTNTFAGQDDYSELPLFHPVDVNYEIDATTKDIIITAIDGVTAGFERNNPEKFVGVMQMAGYVWHSSSGNTFTDGYSAQYYDDADECAILPEAVRLDGTTREFVVHTKYMGKLVDGKIKSYSGVIPTSYTISHNTLNTYGAANGSQYSGGSVLLLSFLEIMTRIKYASLSQDEIIQGCVNYNYQYPAQLAETGVRRILITPAQAANLVVGSGVILGTVGSSNNVNRNATSMYSISTQTGCKITSIENVTISGTTYAAVYVDTPNTFNTTGDGTNTTGNTIISTFSWPTGSCDNILGNDGSPSDPGTGIYPAMIQGIEYSTGIYEVFGDIILQANPATTEYPYGYYEFFICKDASKKATSVTSDYESIGILPYNTNTQATWRYITKITFSNGIAIPTNTQGGSSSTYTRDAFYFMATPSSTTTRECLSFGGLGTGPAFGGLSYVSGGDALSAAYWSIGGRVSCGEAFRA